MHIRQLNGVFVLGQSPVPPSRILLAASFLAFPAISAGSDVGSDTNSQAAAPQLRGMLEPGERADCGRARAASAPTHLLAGAEPEELQADLPAGALREVHRDRAVPVREGGGQVHAARGADREPGQGQARPDRQGHPRDDGPQSRPAHDPRLLDSRRAHRKRRLRDLLQVISHIGVRDVACAVLIVEVGGWQSAEGGGHDEGGREHVLCAERDPVGVWGDGRHRAGDSPRSAAVAAGEARGGGRGRWW
eukprot:2121728-Rhodomonas_salina.1